MVSSAQDKDYDEVEGGPGLGNHLVPYVVASIWRYRLLVVFVAGVGLAIGLFGALVSPNKYRSVGKLFVRLGERESITPEAAMSGTATAARSMPAREAIQNELQVLSAPELFRKIVAKIGVDTVLAPYNPQSRSDSSGPWHVRAFHALQGWWFQSGGGGIPSELPYDRDSFASMILQRTIRIYPEAGTSVISIAYESHSPELARIVVRASLAAAIEMHGEVFDSMASIGAIEAELKRDEELALAAEKKLLEYRVAKGIYEFDSQRNVQLLYLGQLDQQIDAISLEVMRKKAEQSQWASLLTMVSPDRPVRAQAIAPSLSYSSLFGQLLQLEQLQISLESEKRNLSDGEYESRRLSLAKRIEDKTAQLKQETTQLQPVAQKEANPYYESISESVDQSKVELEGLEKQLVALRAVRDDVDKRLAAFEALSPALLLLELDARQKRGIADRLRDGVANIRLMRRMEGNVGVMQEASFEPLKIGPERGKRVVIGGLFGGAIGAILALLLAFRSSKVSGGHDLQMLGLPSDTLLQSSRQRTPDVGSNALPPAFVDLRADIAKFWTVLPYDRREKAGLKLAVLPCGELADASRAAATLAIGLALHSGQRVIYVSCAEQGAWFAERAGLSSGVGWAGVLAQGLKLEAAIQSTPVAGLSYLPIGSVEATQSHPMAAAGFVGLLDGLCADYRFVVLELPPLDQRPEARAMHGIADFVQLVVRKRRTEKASVRDAMKAVNTAQVQLLGVVLQEPNERRPSGRSRIEPVVR